MSQEQPWKRQKAKKKGGAHEKIGNVSLERGSQIFEETRRIQSPA